MLAIQINEDFLTKQKQGNQMAVELGLFPSSCKLYNYFNRKSRTYFNSVI